MVSNQIHGRITRGISPNTTVLKTLQFVQDQLPKWRDMPERTIVTAEEELNGQLCKFLNAAARRESFSMAYFHHEERQAGQRRVDLSALPPEPSVIEGRSYSILDPFLVLEGKRLPAPVSNREREYVVGQGQISGGIQRFKLGLHGARLPRAAIVGYIQGNTVQHWFTSINVWINDLAHGNDGWTTTDCLDDLKIDTATQVARCSSRHSRIDSDTSEIELTHLWIKMS